MRIEFPGAFYHVMSRGSPRRPMVRDDAGLPVAPYLVRRGFGSSATAAAAALGSRGHGGVGRASRRIEQGTAELQRPLERLEKNALNR
jgi:hypothetical protein